MPPRQPALFAHRTVPFGPGLAGFTGNGVATSLREAHAAINPDPTVIEDEFAAAGGTPAATNAGDHTSP